MSAPPELLHAWFRRRAADTPGDVALYAGERAVPYGELASGAARVTDRLAARGVGEHALVGLHVERSPAWVAAALGILDAGAAVVPLPPGDPGRRLRTVADFGELAAVLDGGGAPFAAEAVPLLPLADLLDEGDPPRETRDHPDTSPDAPAFVLSSSGSTGRPRMIVRSHRSFFHRLRWTWARHPFGPGEMGCQKAHMTTTHSLYELFEPLLAGAPTLIVPDAAARNLERFWETVRARGVTRLLVVPSVLRASLDLPGFTPPPLEVLVLMGEYLRAELAVRAVEAFPAGTALYSIYGSTEASSTLVVDLRRSARPGRELPLGEPITPEVEARVLDELLEPVPPGREGRLWIAGPALFSGYWNDPERTAEVLAEDPDGGGRLYDTRDRVRRTEEGELHFLGRIDHTVKIRGFRVELPEVEAVLVSHPDVRQAVVVVENEGTAEAALLGFYTPAAVDRSELFAHLRSRLPAHMVPSALVAVDALPRTDSHKIDRGRLLREHRGRDPGVGDAREELTPTERRVAETWAGVLGHRRFAPDDAFFEVGGTSLTAFVLVEALRDALDLDRARLPAEAVYRHPSVRTMAAHVDGLRAGTSSPAAGPTPLLVPLQSARGRAPDAGQAEARAHGGAPLFVVASAGGTLGAYEKLAAALDTGRAVVGLRDPFLRGERAPSEGFRHWIGRYEEALLERQPEGPYHLCAYSSAGAFGWELARRLRARGEEVALLCLVDPLALDRGSPRRFGHWALRATWEGRAFRSAVRLVAAARAPVMRLRRALGLLPTDPPPDHALSPGDFDALARAFREDTAHLLLLSALLELNTGLPFALEAEDFEGVAPGDRLDVFLERVTGLAPEVERETLERIVVQYEEQVRAHHAYRLRPLDARVLLVEPETPYAGLLAAQLRPYARELVARRAPLGPRSERERAISARFGSLHGHYWCMRDDAFVARLARELGTYL